MFLSHRNRKKTNKGLKKKTKRPVWFVGVDFCFGFFGLFVVHPQKQTKAKRWGKGGGGGGGKPRTFVVVGWGGSNKKTPNPCHKQGGGAEKNGGWGWKQKKKKNQKRGLVFW